jgi:hypothetical protein
MASLLETLTQQLCGGTLKQMSNALGTDEKSTGDAVAAALLILLGGHFGGR